MKTFFALMFIILAIPAAGAAGEGIMPGPDVPVHLADRGFGIPTSMFGTYVRPGELLLYPFFEYYRDEDAEYSPDDFGFELDQDFRGEYRAYEGLVFLAYGLTENISVELEAAVIEATQKRSDEDPTDMPGEVTESGLGDVQTQFNWRWLPESERHPELFSFLEVVYPLQKDKDLIGTSDWEFKLGAGVIRGFEWGTVSARVAGEYDRSEDTTELGEVALEYLKRLSSSWRAYLGVEGSQDEYELITELQWHFTDSAFVKLNNAFGLTSKAADWAPEVGIMFSLGPN